MFSFYQKFSDWLILDLFSVGDGHLSEALNFFIYDFLKIVTLLVIITHFMSTLRYYLPIKRIREFLVRKNLYGLDYLFAAIFGVITPFCSCSSIPLFAGFLQAGVPLGVTFTFLITSPLINEVAITILFGTFGWRVAVIYTALGMTIGILGGIIIKRLKMEKYIAEYIRKSKLENSKREFSKLKINTEVFKKILREAFEIIKKLILYITVAIALGAIIHGYIPEGFFVKYLEKASFLDVPIAVALAVPMYANASGVIPIVESLVDKGVPVGTAIAFMMGVVGLSLPEAIMLKKVMDRRLLLTFFGIVTAAIIVTGYLLNMFI